MQHTTRVSLSVLLGAVIISFCIVSFASAQNPFRLQFPIQDLGGCTSYDFCKTYCDDATHAEACLTFALNNGLVSGEAADRAEKLANIKNGPGGCNTPKGCESYCSVPAHLKECIASAEAKGIRVPEEARKIQAAIENGATLPGNCTSKEDCEKKCADPQFAEQCTAFLKNAGVITDVQAGKRKKFLELVAQGATPGGCGTEAECSKYCTESAHREECSQFAQKLGVAKRETDAFKRFQEVGGPGGCRSKEECDAFCKDNEDECRTLFMKMHSELVPLDVKRDVEDNAKRFREKLQAAPEEVKNCIESVTGESIDQIELSPSFTQETKKCFRAPSLPPPANMDMRRMVAPSEALKECLEERGFTGEGQPPMDLMKQCYEKIAPVPQRAIPGERKPACPAMPRITSCPEGMRLEQKSIEGCGVYGRCMLPAGTAPTAPENYAEFCAQHPEECRMKMMTPPSERPLPAPAPRQYPQYPIEPRTYTAPSTEGAIPRDFHFQPQQPSPGQYPYPAQPPSYIPPSGMPQTYPSSPQTSFPERSAGMPLPPPASQPTVSPRTAIEPPSLLGFIEASFEGLFGDK